MIINAHRGFAASVVWSPDSQRLASVGMDGFARLWDAQDGSALGEVAAHEGPAASAAFTSLGRELVTGASNAEIKVWALPDFELRYELSGHTGRVGALAAHLEGSPIVSASDDGNVIIYTGPDQSLVVEGLGERMTTVDLSPDGTLIAAGGQSRDVMVYDLMSGRAQRLEGHDSTVGSVTFSTSGMQLYSLGAEGVLRVWDTGSWTTEDAVPVQGFGPYAMAPGGSVMALAHDGDLITMNRNGTVVGTRAVGDLEIYSLRYSPGGDRLAAACTDGSLRVWPTDY